MHFPRLAFVDVETTGLGAGNHRIAEIGVVTVDEDGVTEWGTLLDPGRRVASPPNEFDAEPAYFCADTMAGAVDALLAEPLLPAHVDLRMIDALPERPGVYMFDGDDDRLLHVGRAANLRRDVKRYFRLDRDCARALALSHRLTRI